MKKHLLVLVFLLSAIQLSRAQNAYYDAVNLRTLIVTDANGTHFNTDSLTKAGNVLFNYMKWPANVTSANWQTIVGELSAGPKNANPIISPFLPTIGGSPGPISSGINSAINSIGNLNVTNFADGVAQFLIERGKQEINVAFFQRMQTFIITHPEVKIAFPSTAGFINSIESYNYSAMLPALRAAFQKDLNALTGNLIKLRDISNYVGYTNNDTVKAICKFLNTTLPGRSGISALIVADGISKGNNAADIINQLATDTVSNPNSAGDSFSNIIQFVNLTSNSIRSNDPARIWITKQQIANLVKDNITLKLYLGLLYAQDVKNAHHIQFVFDNGKDKPSSTITLQKFLTNLTSHWSTASGTFTQSFSNMANAASDVADNTKNILNIKNQGDQASILAYADYASSISGFLKSAMGFLPSNSSVQPEFAKITNDIQKFTDVIEDAANSYYYIKSQNYAALVLSTSSIIAEVAGSNYNTLKKDYITYGTFMADIIGAKNSSDVESAIEAVALPAGSYSIKQKSKFNISLNGYIGYTADINHGQGVSAPIGFAFTLGSDPTPPKKGEIPVTFFIGLIDVGSFVSYRLNNGTTDQIKQQVTLESIIVPSGQIFFEIPKWPVAIGGGVRMTPKISYSTTTNTTYTVPSKAAFNLSILIDIPLFTLYNKSF